jgi:hypothetical protein
MPQNLEKWKKPFILLYLPNGEHVEYMGIKRFQRDGNVIQFISSQGELVKTSLLFKFIADPTDAGCYPLEGPIKG